MRVRFSRRALADLDRACRRSDEGGPSGAQEVLRAIHASTRLIAQHPYASVATTDPDLRVRLERRGGFKLFYVIAESTIDVAHIRHGAQGWDGGIISVIWCPPLTA